MYGTLIIADIRPKLHSKLHKIEDTTSEKKNSIVHCTAVGVTSEPQT